MSDAHHAHAFWSDPTRLAWIEAVCDADDVTLFVGAGASMEIGLPSWKVLVTDLLEQVAPAFGVEHPSQVSAFARLVLEEEGIMGAAELARAALGDDFETAAVTALYRKRVDPAPGPTAKAVARLYEVLAGKCEIATLNYDYLIERALTELKVGPVEAVADHKAHPGVHVVRHLHGGRSPDPNESAFPDAVGEFILAEADYLNRDDAWRSTFFVNRLLNSTCIFVGMSMTDLNVLRYLYQAGDLRGKSSPNHHAILASGQPARTPEGRAAHDARLNASTERWRSIGVAAIWVEHFLQSSQLLHEVEFRLRFPESYAIYGDRVREWEALINSPGALLDVSTTATFRKNQNDTQFELEGILAFIREVVAHDLGGIPSDETLGLHLWVRRFDDRALLQWCAADRVWCDPTTLAPVPISATAEWIAVHAFCAGTPHDAAIADPTSRWRFVRGYPIFLDDADWGRLPVGVVTLASSMSASQEHSCIQRVTPSVADDIYDYINEVAAELLNPLLTTPESDA